jgi:hypothetical protein
MFIPFFCNAWNHALKSLFSIAPSIARAKLSNCFILSCFRSRRICLFSSDLCHVLALSALSCLMTFIKHISFQASSEIQPGLDFNDQKSVALATSTIPCTQHLSLLRGLIERESAFIPSCSLYGHSSISSCPCPPSDLAGLFFRHDMPYMDHFEAHGCNDRLI